MDGAEWKLTSSFWSCRVVVSREHPSHPDTGDCSDPEVASLSSQPTSPSPGSSVTSSACASPQPSLSHNLWNSVCMNVQLRVHQFDSSQRAFSSFFLIWLGNIISSYPSLKVLKGLLFAVRQSCRWLTRGLCYQKLWADLDIWKCGRKKKHLMIASLHFIQHVQTQREVNF